MVSLQTSGKETVRRYALLSLVSIVLGILFTIYISYSETGYLPPIRDQFKKYALTVLCTVVISLVVFRVDLILDKFISWRNNFLVRFFVGFLANTLVTLTFVAISSLYLIVASTEATLKVSILFIISIFIYEIFYGWFYSYRYYAITQVEGIRSERWQLELQFESLKNQISPHYLFNCLNTISSLLYKDSQMAEEFIRRMADTFKYVLSNQKQQLVPVRQEIEFVKAYYYLLQVRYEHHLKLEINLPKSILDTPIPPLTLQILVENAVKHNQISKEQPLLVYISAKDNTHIIVTSTKTTSIKPSHSFKIGLENIRNRYEFFSTDKIIIKDEEKFTVQLPVLKAARERKNKKQSEI
ncbi:MAG TPA: histidine kinase [Cyclobacteriaceae bacterium]|nr:histidine kinase [Cyclobacteriaceae bacterium]